MEKESEMLSLWVGPSSQRTAHHFYCLQAEQFFDEAEDPTNHNALWNFKDKYMQEKYPRMIIFDTESEQLTRIRKINHEKILKKMNEPSKNDVYFPFQYMPQPEEEEGEEQQSPNQWLYEHWHANEDNYSLIDVQFNESRVSYDLWEAFFKYQSDQYEDKVRRHLEKTDFLRLFTVCTDADKLGFTNRIVEYLRDECPKRSIVLTSLSNQKGENYYNQCFLPLVGHIAPQVNLLVDLNIQPSAHAYFQGDDFYHSITPVLNSLYTPFMLKNVNCDQFLLKIQHDNRTIFNIASTLPVIDQQMSLHPLTNILQYLPKIDLKSGKKQEESPEMKNKLNYANNTFLNIIEPSKQSPKIKAQLETIKPLPSQVIAESFVIKGNFKEVTELFQQKTNNFEIKYLKGILAMNPKANLRYSQFYRQHYGQVVQNFPFHTVLFQHAGFGPSMRNFMKLNAGKSVGSELISEWRESVLAQADCYSQCIHDESD